MTYTILRVSLFFDGDLVTVGKVFADSIEHVSKLIGLGTSVRVQLKLDCQLVNCFEVPVEVDGQGDEGNIRTTVLVMENIPHQIYPSDLPQITDKNTLRLAYKKSLRIN